MTKDRKAFERLPKTVVPVNYKLKLCPNMEKFTFVGEQSIQVEVKEATSVIIMNCAEIEIQKVVLAAGGADLVPSDIKLSAEDETITLTFSSPLPLGPAALNMNFTGILNDKLRGFYRSAYTSAIDGTKKHIAVTQFESTDARRAFPCWDEPSCKATFDVTLVSPNAAVALSNMPVIKEEPDASNSGMKISTYDTTPIMSTYLLAFVIGEFDFVEGKDKNGVLVRVYTPVGKKEQGEFALDVAVKTLPFYNDYFEIPYPLPKMDLIAIPDFSAGAMENWGLVTYRETALLVDPLNTSSNTKQWVALVVGHELAHQWFGNLVTMEWWTHLWLNEGFASWIEYLCVDYCFPDWNIWLQFINMDFKNALQLDAMDTSHPIEVPVGHPDEVDEIFDHISYCKGNSVIRMLHNFLGAEPFRQGLAAYLKKFQYSNAVTEDLWASLEETSGQPVNKIMSTWTSKMGYPMLTCSVDESKDKTVLTITQQKFCANGDTSSDFEWLVPVTIITQSSSEPQKLLLDKRTTTMELDNCKPGDWVKINPEQIGLYRVQYSEGMIQALLPAIKNLTLTAADRLGVQDDLFALAKAGYTKTSTLLTLMGAYVNERNYVVLSNIRLNLGELGSLFSHLPVKTKFQDMNRKIFSRVLAEVGWDKRDEDSHTDSLLRNMLIGCLGKSNDTAVIDECKKRFANHYDGTVVLPADIRGAVYAIVRANGGEKEYNQLMDLFTKTDLHEERERVQRVLGSGPGAELRAKALEFAVSPTVRTNDTPFVIASVAGYNYEGRDEAWSFTKKNYSMFLERYSGGFLFTRLIKVCCSDFSDMNKYKDVELFFSENKAPSAERAVKQSLENIKLRAGWLERDGAAVEEWFTANGI